MRRMSVTLVLIGLLVASCQPSASEKPTEPTMDPVAFQQAFFQLLQSTSNWNQLGRPDKTVAVQRMIDLYKVRENTAILFDAEFYVDRIDQATQTAPALLNLPLPELLKIMAVSEFDFYNGQDKDALAREVLGDQMYEAIIEQRQRQGI